MSTGNLNIQTPTPISRPSSYHDILLTVDLSIYKDDAEKLYGYAVDLQSHCRQLSHNSDKDLDRSQSGKSSRRTTDDSITKKKAAAIAASRKGIAITFNPANNKLEVVQMRDITGTKSYKLFNSKDVNFDIQFPTTLQANCHPFTGGTTAFTFISERTTITSFQALIIKKKL